MPLRPTVRCILTSLLLVSALRDPALQASGWYFGNADVLGLLEEGRSETSIIERIAEERTEIFKFGTEDLLALKNAGASEGVISVMLARSRQSPGKNVPPDAMDTFKSLKAETLTLATRQGQLELGFSRGEFVYEDLGPRLHLDYPGLHASLRTTDPRPSLLVRSESDPTTRYDLTSLSSLTKKNLRSLKVKMKARAFSNVPVPQKDYVIACTATKEGKGVWRITPKADLEPGEYGLLDGVRIFDFGVDSSPNPSAVPSENPRPGDAPPSADRRRPDPEPSRAAAIGGTACDFWPGIAVPPDSKIWTG